MVWTAKRGNVLLTALAAILMSSLGVAVLAFVAWFTLFAGSSLPGS